MIFEDKNWKIIDKDLYDKIINERNKSQTYLYYFIVVVYKDDNNTKTIIMNNSGDLQDIENLNILYKYYIEKCHYYNKFNNDLYADGEPYFIHDIGYFLIDGDIPTNEEEKVKINEMFKKYNENYICNSLEDDRKFLLLNKSVINF